jgi:hypothetical protein
MPQPNRALALCSWAELAIDPIVVISLGPAENYRLERWGVSGLIDVGLLGPNPDHSILRPENAAVAFAGTKISISSGLRQAPRSAAQSRFVSFWSCSHLFKGSPTRSCGSRFNRTMPVLIGRRLPPAPCQQTGRLSRPLAGSVLAESPVRNRGKFSDETGRVTLQFFRCSVCPGAHRHKRSYPIGISAIAASVHQGGMWVICLRPACLRHLSSNINNGASI